jgi:hypothetical protein
VHAASNRVHICTGVALGSVSLVIFTGAVYSQLPNDSVLANPSVRGNAPAATGVLFGACVLVVLRASNYLLE